MPTVDLSFSGLYTTPNPFSKAPEGSLEVADNVILSAPGVIEPRRGYSATAVNPSGNIARVFPWNPTYLTTAASGEFVNNPSGGLLVTFATNGDMRTYSDKWGWSTSYGTYAAPDAFTPIRAATSAKSLFWTTATGVKALDVMGGAALGVGLIPSPQVDYVTSGINDGYLASLSQAAYRVVLCKYDSNGHLVQSAPSPRAVAFGNVAGWLVSVSVKAYLPYNLNGATFIQLYRSASVGAGLDPTDELFLVAEHALTASDIAAHEVIFDYDKTPDGFLSIPLYTNANTGQGAGASNDTPPLAKELCEFNGALLYANTLESSSISLQMIGQNMAPATHVVIGGDVYIGSDVSENPAARQFFLQTLSSPSGNVESTSRSLCRCINYYNTHVKTSGQRVAAYYVSGPGDNPGQMFIQEVGVGGGDFSISATSGAWVPDLSNSAVEWSDSAPSPAKIWWSTPGVPWGVPADNSVIVGAADKAILRAVCVRSTVFIFKEDGLFTLQGNDPANFDFRPFDPNLILIAPESVAVVNNAVFAYTNRGAVYVTEAGVSPAISGPVDRDISIAWAQSSAFTTATFGVAYENDLLWCLATPGGGNDPACSQQYIFNADNPSWTRWTIPTARHGTFNPATNQLVWAVGSTLWQERRGFASTDQQDPGFTIACPSTGLSQTLTFPTSLHGLAVGDLVTQAPLVARVASVSGAVVTFDAAYTWTSATLTVYKAIDCRFKFLPLGAGDPLSEKLFMDVYFSFKQADFPTCSVGFDTNAVNTATFAARTGPPRAAWGAFPWGGAGWGVVSKNFVMRAVPPQGVLRANTLGLTVVIRQAQCYWQLQGVTLIVEPSSETPSR